MSATFEGYAPPEERPPLAAYATFATVFHTAMAAAVVAARRSGRDLPARVDAGDVVLIGTASYKLSRLISKKKITAFVRAPFTELEGKAGPAELEEKPRGSGVKRAFGELLLCPYCLGLWASGGFHVGLLFAPRSTRFTASVLTAMAISDFLQAVSKATDQRGSPEPPTDGQAPPSGTGG